MNSEKYCRVLCDDLFLAVAEVMGEQRMLMHDNASVYRSKYTTKWISDHELNCLQWPAKSPHFNVNANVWGMMVRIVFKDGKQYSDAKCIYNCNCRCLG